MVCCSLNVNKKQKGLSERVSERPFYGATIFYLKYANIMQISLRSSRNRTTTTTNAHHGYCIAENTRVDICEINFHWCKEGGCASMNANL